MKALIILTLLLTNSMSYALTRVRPIVSNTNEYENVGELSSVQNGFPFVGITDGFQILDRTYILASETRPTIYDPWEYDGSGNYILKFAVSSGRVFLGKKFYQNTAVTTCGVSSSGIGGYDDGDPFALSSLAYLYLVPNGDGFGCILSQHDDGPVTSFPEGWKRYAAVNNFGGFLRERDFKSGISLSAGVNVNRDTSCFSVTFNVPEGFKKYSWIHIFGRSKHHSAMALYSDNTCTQKIIDVPVLSMFFSKYYYASIPFDVAHSSGVYYFKGVLNASQLSGSQSNISVGLKDHFDEILNSFDEVLK